VVVLAQDEARLLKHNYIGTEHLLLGLLREEEGLAARVLESLDVTLEEAREQVLRVVGRGNEVTSGQIPFTPRAKKVLELGLRESQSLGHTYIGTEHILLGLVREGEGVAARILYEIGAYPVQLREELIGMLSGPGRREEHASADVKIEEVRAQKEAAIEQRDFELAARLRDVERRLVGERFGPAPVAVPTSPILAHSRTGMRAISPSWPAMLVGGALLGLGLLLGWTVWG
jgi:ATP-dependent Clp protease ATP-binding subunit ClpA